MTDGPFDIVSFHTWAIMHHEDAKSRWQRP